MIFTLTGGDTTRTLTVDRANDVAEIYYIYDETGAVYSIPQDDLIGLCKAPRDLYEPQTLTDKMPADIAEMEVGALTFTRVDGAWALDGEPDYPLDQDAVQKMANTLCNLQTEWTITAPEDGGYGLKDPDRRRGAQLYRRHGADGAVRQPDPGGRGRLLPVVQQRPQRRV